MRRVNRGRLSAGIFTILLVAAQGVRADEVAPRLAWTLSDRGLATLSFDDTSLLRHPSDGVLSFFGGELRETDGATTRIDDSKGVWRLDKDSSTVTLDQPWGKLEGKYTAVNDSRLDIRLTISNSSAATITGAAVKVARMTYPAGLKVSTVLTPPSPFAGGNWAGPSADTVPPAALAAFDRGSLLVAATDGFDQSISCGLFFSESEGTVNRAGIGFGPIGPGGRKSFTITLRAGPADASLRSLGGDVLDGYAKAWPFALEWPDRRPMGKVFLASSGNGPDRPDTNPNRWFMNDAATDVSTDAGKEAFREKLLKYADTVIAALREMGAQGAITWDPEGQRTGHTYYGDPRIISDIAPEMEHRGTHARATIDEYFRRFEEAGLRHGVCVRPQRVRKDGKFWVQDELKDPAERMNELEAKIGHAWKRWKSTLVYIDSDYDVTARQYRDLHAKFPEVLLIPEWEQPLHFSCTAPLQSVSHFGIGQARTPGGVRDLYPNAFCVTFVDGISRDPKVQNAVAAGVEGGDVMMINGWYSSPDTKAVAETYREHAPAKSPR